jgi:hypothetical protein
MWMLAQGLSCVVNAGQFSLAQAGMNFFVANMVQQDRGTIFAAF